MEPTRGHVAGDPRAALEIDLIEAVAKRAPPGVNTMAEIPGAPAAVGSGDEGSGRTEVPRELFRAELLVRAAAQIAEIRPRSPLRIGYIGEDFLFCDRARELGFEVWIDPSITLGHMGVQEYTGNFGNDVLYPMIVPQKDVA